MPIFKSPNPSSCVQCHLAGVDLKDYILPDSEKTFRSLRDQGLIDLDHPERSKIMTFIDRGKEEKTGLARIDEKVRTAEHDAFLAWIRSCAADPKLRNAPALPEGERAKPKTADVVIRHARSDALLESFERNVWSWRFRCMNCHTEGNPANEKHRKEYGDRVAWVKKDGAAATLEYLLTSKLIDANNPERSLLLRKPLGEKHGGGLKFVVGDDAYQGFRTWIEDVAAIRNQKYAKASDLPVPKDSTRRFGTDIWFKLSDSPPAWHDKFLRVELFARDAEGRNWEREPIAVSDRVVWGKGKLWQHNMTLLAAKDSPRAKQWQSGKPTLADGRYLVRVFVDAEGRLVKDWKSRLGEADRVGEAEFQAHWQDGYNGMMSLSANQIRK
ncbi:MAG: hypothetical protein U0798_18135 [Gemmataceae bacterium]